MTQEPIGFRRAIGLSLSVIPRAWRMRWVALVFISFISSGLETVSAVAVLSLIQIISNPGHLSVTALVPAMARISQTMGMADPAIILAGGIALFYLAKNLFAAYATYQQANVAFASGAEFARALFGAYLSAPYAYHLRKNSAEIQRNVGAAVDAVFNDLLFSLVGLGSELLMTLGLLAVTFFVAPLTTIMVVAALGVMTGLIYWVTQKRIYRWGADSQALAKSIIMTVEQSLGALKEIKILGREGYFIEQFERRRRRGAHLQAMRQTTQQVPRLTLETLFIVLVALVLTASKFTVETAGGVLPLLGLYAYTGFRVMPSVARSLSYLQNIRFGSAMLQEVQGDFAMLEQRDGDTTFALARVRAFAGQVAFRDVSFAYPGSERPALQGLDLAIRRGESVGIVGGTGSGKSTLLDLLAGLYEPTHGEILVDGANLRDIVTEWQRGIGYVPQLVFLLDDTVRRNIALGIADRDIDDARLTEVVRIVQLDDVVSALPAGLDTIVGQHGVRLSGGQRQRIAIARALYRGPDLLLLDEATAALDNRTEYYLSEAVQQLSGTMTLVIVAHRLQTVRKCDRVIVMEHGRIVDAGTYDDLLANSPPFRRLATHSLEGGMVE